jgi:hypothetical protein
MGVRIAAAALLAATAGCPADDTALPDGGGTDGGTELRVEWTGRPAALPAALSSDLTLERAMLRTEDLRVVGDASTLELRREELEWERDAAPAPDVVAGAPPGLYSRLLFEVEGEGDEYSYELSGMVRVGTTTRPFLIRDREELAISLDFSIMLKAGASARIPVRVELDKLVEAVDFAQVPVQGGTYLVEDGAQLASVRDKLRQAFSVH